MVLQRPDKAYCGPIALINAHKYVYGYYPNITSSRLGSQLNTDEEYGTDPSEILSNSYVKVKNKTFNINNILEMDAFILLYILSYNECHYVFVHKENSKYIVYNYYCDRSGQFCTKSFTPYYFKRKLLKKMRICDGLTYPIAWGLNY